MKRKERPAWQYVLGAVALALLVNGLLFGLGLRGSGGQRSRADFPLLPAPWVIGTVWTFLLAAMGLAQWLLLQRLRWKPEARSLRWLVPLLFLNCLLYPAYTGNFSSELRGLVGNLATLALAAYMAGRLHAVTRAGSALIGLVVAWTLFATFATFRLPG